MLTTRRAHVLIAIVAATVLTAVALALSAGHSRASFLTPLTPAAPSASRVPFPAWAHGGATARAASSPSQTALHQISAPPAPRGNGPADAQHDDASTGSPEIFARAARLNGALLPDSFAARIPTPPPRAMVVAAAA